MSVHAGRAAPLNAGPHGFSEILYDFTSVTNNNGSAFAGISVNTAFYNVINTFGLLLGRFAIMVPVLALAGALAAKQAVAASAGTFRTDTPMFVGLLTGVGADRRGADVLPRRVARPDRRAIQSREVLLMSAVGKLAVRAESRRPGRRPRAAPGRAAPRRGPRAVRSRRSWAGPRWTPSGSLTPGSR